MCCKADNTVREAKNRFVLTWLHLQCLRGRFRTATLAMPRKSHSHDRIGWKMMEKVNLQICSLSWHQLLTLFTFAQTHVCPVVQTSFGEYWVDGWQIVTPCWLMRLGHSQSCCHKASCKIILLSWQARTWWKFWRMNAKSRAWRIGLVSTLTSGSWSSMLLG